jgi:hypothetical protein
VVFLSGHESVQFSLSFIYICIPVRDLIIKRGGLVSIIRFNTATFLCVSLDITRTSNAIWRCLFYFSLIWGRSDFSVCWYYWNCWPSLFKFSTWHYPCKLYIVDKSYKCLDGDRGKKNIYVKPKGPIYFWKKDITSLSTRSWWRQ